ncbi:lamin tail domain-containing protein [Pontiellaceae bacterium B1224]|nr:lamin tail domain-containing protein [Pontiellaceae bacterium B1224]
MIFKVRVFLILLTIALFACRQGVAQTIRISEIMADNEDTLLDMNGEASDWIELYNTTDAPVSLSGWYLTDVATNLTKWSFPATEIAANGFLIIFASGSDNQPVAGTELHANFKLSASGEYIALTRPDGSTIEDAHDFPALAEDRSFGYSFEKTGGSVLLDAGASCAAHVPTSAADAAGWQETSFSDAAWLQGATGVGYEKQGSTFASQINLDASSMSGVNGSIYIRIPFSLDDPAFISELSLKMKYDDAFVAYLNGTLVASSSNADLPPSWDSLATAAHDNDAALLFESFGLSAHIGALNMGDNILAIHGMNDSVAGGRKDRTDLFILPRLEASYAGTIEPESAGHLDSATPGYANSETYYEDFVETPITTPERGFYDAPFSVSVSNVTAGATIRYTMDGSEPTEASTEYTGPVTISGTTCFRVGGFVEGWKPSYPRTDTYIFVDDVVTQPEYEENIVGANATSSSGQKMIYGMDPNVVGKTYYDASNQLVTVQDALKAIPTISITTDHENLFDPSKGIYVNAAVRWEVPASIELINPDASEGFEIYAGLRIRGGYSRHDNYPKHAFRLFFRDEYGTGKLRYPMFEDEGVDEFDKIDLRTAMNYNWAKENNPLNTFLRDVFARDTALDMGQENPRSRYYHLYLNGQYWGLYMTEERPVATFGASYYGGDKDDYDAIKIQSWTEPDGYSIEVTDGTLDAYERLYNAAMAGFTNNADYFAVQGLDANGETDTTLERLLDVENMIDYLLVIYYTAASDNCITSFAGGYEKLNNMYAIYNRANPDGFKWFQHDSEHSLDTNKNLDFTGPFPHENFTLFKYFNAMTLHEKLSVNEEYRLTFADRVHKHMFNDGALVRTNCEARLDCRAAQIDRAIVANAARWGNTDLDRDTWVDAVVTTRLFFARSDDRCLEVIEYLDDDGLIPSVNPPALSLFSGLVAQGTPITLSTASGTIYFTTDGTDPRAVGGAINGAAYSGPIVISRPTHLKARILFNGEWSALTEATYWTTEIPLAITELMYHAPNGNPHDFIEIRNNSGEAVSLKGYKLDNAIDFKFKNAEQTSLAPGEYLVAVDDYAAFDSTYPFSDINIAGEFSGDLSNGGEKVDLEFRDQDLISFTYSDARNWPQAADGAGHSLVPVDSAMNNQERGSLDYGGNWRASTCLGGSPGAADPQLYPTVVLNEISAHTDTGLAPPFDSNDKIELYNTSDSPVTLSGWYLSDSLDEPTKWLIPTTTISGNGFIVFDESDFHVDGINGFGLNKAGEQVILSAPDRVVDAVRFKGQENVNTGVSWGRYPDGTGDWLTTVPTLGNPNALKAATVRISELMYNPIQPGNDYEYIKIENIGTASQTFQNNTGTYRIDGGVGFDFPADTTLPAGETLWILSFNPTNTVKLNLFCGAYGLTAAQENFLGGYSGSLSDRGERVALERPQDSDDPENPQDISWVVIDELFYFDQSPWPTGADATGNPLIRTGFSSWGAPSATDTDADRMDDSWEMDHFQSLEQVNPDWDFDGQSNLEEYIADSDPTNASSMFIIEELQVPTLGWTAKVGRTYSVYWTDDLNQPFVRVASGLTSGTYTDSTAADRDGPNYYYINVEIK